jgi:hypothetical protein
MQPASPDEAKTLLRSLFDFSFNSLITTKIIRIFYALFVVILSLGALGFLASGINQGGSIAVVTLIAVPVGYLLYLLFIRLLMELYIIIYKISEDVRAMRMVAPGTSLGPVETHLGYAPGQYAAPQYPPPSVQ